MWILFLVLLYLIVLSVYDCREKAVPLIFLYIGMTGMVCIFACRMAIEIQKEEGWLWMQSGINMIITLLAGMIPGIFVVIISAVTQKIGLADGIVLSIVGAILGLRDILLVLYISLLCFSLCAMVLLLMRRIRMKATLPYLPFLTIAVAVEQAVARIWEV